MQMPTLERTCTVAMPVEKAEECWNAFTSKQQQSGGSAPTSQGNGAADPGTVYFNEAGKGKTEVTMQLDPQGLADGDEQTLNQRVDGFLNNFKKFAESR
jgi:hypothetical protein